MFKKPIAATQGHAVSGADRKKIRRAVEKEFNATEEQLEQLLPAKAGQLEVAKLPAPSRCHIYLLDKQPVLLDTSGKGDYIITVFGLWRAPSLLPQVHLKHPLVSKYVIGGADVMLPGVDLPPAGLPPFNKGDLVAVCVPGNPAPIAVGYAGMNATDAPAASHGKGRFIEVVQAYGDALWAGLGARAVPNDGFTPEVVLSLEGGNSEEEEEDSDAAAAGSGGVEGGSQLSADTAAGGSGQQEASSSQPSIAAAASTVAGGRTDNSSSSSSPAQQQEQMQQQQQQQRSMEELLEMVLLQALHKSVKEGDLPLAGSVLWAKHMVPNRPAEAVLDVKKSRFKKMSAFIKEYTKAGLLTSKEDKHTGDYIITSINRRHDLYDTYRPYKAAATAAAAASSNGSAAAAGEGGEAGGVGAGGAPLGELLVEEVYRPNVKEFKALFTAAGAPPDGVYTPPEVHEVVLGYVRQQGLDAAAPDPRLLLLDPLLCDALYKGLVNVKAGERFPTHIAKAELRAACMRRCQLQVRLTRGALQRVKKGSPPSVQISSERRQGNKQVTRIVGVEDFLVAAGVVASECQKKFACSTTVVELPGKNNPGFEVVIQGQVVDKVADHLVQTYGIPKQYILVKK